METIESLFPEIFPTTEGFKADCPYCGKKQKLWWNTEKNVGCCFEAGCAWHYSKGGVTPYRLKALLRKEGIKYIAPPIKFSWSTNPYNAAWLPDEFKMLDELDEPLSQSIYAYLNSRGLHTKTLRRQKVGYCETGKYWGYIIFPVFDAEGKVIYWQGRRFKNRDRKFFNPPCSNKKEIFYQIGGSSETKRIVIVESVINALTLDSKENITKRRVIMALLGKTLSEHQLDHIRAYRYLKDVVIALDPDAKQDALNMAKKIASCGLAVRIAELPENEDINSVGGLKAWTAIYKAKPFQEIKYSSPVENFSILGRK